MIVKSWNKSFLTRPFRLEVCHDLKLHLAIRCVLGCPPKTKPQAVWGLKNCTSRLCLIGQCSCCGHQHLQYSICLFISGWRFPRWSSPPSRILFTRSLIFVAITNQRRTRKSWSSISSSCSSSVSFLSWLFSFSPFWPSFSSSFFRPLHFQRYWETIHFCYYFEAIYRKRLMKTQK